MIVRKCYGPPGTGKTARLMELVEHEVQGGTPLQRIGYFSFTKAAADVIRDRLGASIDDMRWFRTIHGACVRAMGIGGAIVTTADYRVFSAASRMKITANDLALDGDEAFQGNDFNVTLRALQLAATTLRPIDEVLRQMPQHPNLTRERVRQFDEAWRGWKAEQKRFDFMDMLVDYDRDGRPLPLDVAFLDEAQDLSELQWRVFRKMVAGCKRVYMAGDDDQAIYTFIGGSEYGFLDFAADEEEVLTTSRRVPTAIGARADGIIKRVGHRKDKPVQWREAAGDVQVMNMEPGSMPWRKWLTQYGGGGIMVLCRHRSGARDFSDELTAVGVPHSLHGESLHSWKEAKIVHTYFNLGQGDGDATPRQAAALIEAFGLDASGLRDTPRRKRVTREECERAGVDFGTPKWSQLLGAVGGGTGTGGRSTTGRGVARRYEHLRRLVNSEGWEALAKEPAVEVMTMHGSKGREAELVVIDPACTGIVRRNLLTPTEMRLSYVSLTRAKQQAVILVPRTDNYIHHFF